MTLIIANKNNMWTDRMISGSYESENDFHKQLIIEREKEKKCIVAITGLAIYLQMAERVQKKIEFTSTKQFIVDLRIAIIDEAKRSKFERKESVDYEHIILQLIVIDGEKIYKCDEFGFVKEYSEGYKCGGCGATVAETILEYTDMKPEAVIKEVNKKQPGAVSKEFDHNTI